MHFFTLHLRRMKGNLCLMKNPRFIESGRTAGNRLPSPGKVKKAVSKPATDLENRSPPFRVKKGVGALRHKPYYSSNSVSSPPQGKEQSTHEQVLNSYFTRAIFVCTGHNKRKILDSSSFPRSKSQLN